MPENGALRREWSDFAAASVESLCAEIRQAVEGASPRTALGLMTIGHSHSSYAGYPITRWMPVRTVLNEARRPLWPWAVTASPLTRCAPARRRITSRSWRPSRRSAPCGRCCWRGAEGLPLMGLWPADHRELMARRQVDDRGWFWEGGAYDMQRPNALAEMGVPLTTDPRTACGVLLAGRVAEAFGDEELRDMLARGVWMDGEALGVFWARGLGELAGLRPGERLPGGMAERRTMHPLNGAGAGDVREALAGRGISPAT